MLSNPVNISIYVWDFIWQANVFDVLFIKWNIQHCQDQDGNFS